jgi:hypothetical protein
MTTPDHPYGNDDGSTRLGRDTAPSRTSSGADVTSRMTGTSGRHAGHDETDHETHRDARHDHDTRERGVVTDTSRPADRRDHVDTHVTHAKTSAAATFALVFGLSALFCGLTGILAPVAVLFGIIGVILGIAGRKMALRPGVTGRSVATGGLVTAVLGLLLGLAVIAGMAVYVNEQGLDGLQDRIDNARDSLPTGQDVVDAVPGS